MRITVLATSVEIVDRAPLKKLLATLRSPVDAERVLVAEKLCEHLDNANLRPEDLELPSAAKPQRRWPRDWIKTVDLLLDEVDDPLERAFLCGIQGRIYLGPDHGDRVNALLTEARRRGQVHSPRI